ncbi:hypothetical protein BEH94_07540 [Candidatus Altiarchaeales archaeon WOR_SM1_SCG]|nr:hypothetical protein BEH94_07540 [Candidatus Altiarchaeales archaeon WOR_SM1_SCG]
MPNFSVILVEPIYSGNVGSVARVMKNFGFKDLILVNPPEITREAKARAMHARDVLENARIFGKFDDLQGEFDFLVATIAVIASDRNSLRTPIFPEQLKSSLDFDGNIGVVFGREDNGLSNEELKQCDLLVTIPANPEYQTLNLAQSVAVILYEIFKLKSKSHSEPQLGKTCEANKIEKEFVLRNFNALVDAVGLLDFKADIAKKTFRSVVGRGFISGREAFTLTGVFRRAHDTIMKLNLKKEK